jgi:hypothetical protein
MSRDAPPPENLPFSTWVVLPAPGPEMDISYNHIERVGLLSEGTTVIGNMKVYRGSEPGVEKSVK